MPGEGWEVSDVNEGHSRTWPDWRSLLFVPASQPALLDKAAERGADALILDLEDAVAEADKPAARTAAAEAAGRLHAGNVNVLVRVNAGPLAMMRDLEACVGPGVQAFVLPKAERPERLAMTDELLADLEEDAGLPVGAIGLVALVETARGLLAAAELAEATPRVMALALGAEDLALDLGGEPVPEVLTEPARRIAWSAHAAGRAAVGFPDSIANIRDSGRLQTALAAAGRLGFSAAMCVHPAQIELCHQAFAVTADEAEHAQRVADAFEQAQRQGTAVCTLDGQMIDRPVVQRAHATLARWRRQNPDPSPD